MRRTRRSGWSRLETRARSGPPHSHSVFPIGSISKQFTAAVILALADQGKVQLDAPVGRYLPEWFADEPGLRVEHLLVGTTPENRIYWAWPL